MKKTISRAKEEGFVKTLFNRKRVIKELNNPVYTIRQSGERIALNTPIQGTSADIIKLAMVKVYNEFLKHNLKSKMIIQVHDELIFDVVSDELDKVKNIVKQTSLAAQVDGSPPASAGETHSIPGGFHMPQATMPMHHNY